MTQDEPRGSNGVAQPTEAVDGEVEWGLAFEPGSVLGERYRIRSVLGAGGMGEVWHAFDLKLRVEVALKGVRPELVVDETRRESLRSEVRAAREVVSPSVCRVFDLIEIDGQELVSMEYVDGTTLLEVLRERAPLDPPEAQEIASQFLAGLEAIHAAGLVHRDVKPENIMVTRTGRVVVMDFGLARSAAEGAGTVSGTRAYMAPEQAEGVTDARSDLFSAGVILAEMVSPGGIRDFESRKGVWDGVRSEPVQVPDSPWSPVVRRAVARDPENRFQSAHELARALEEVAFRVHDETGLEPYPGLSSFDEDDAEYFFGREAEVEAVWQKLESAQLLGIIGASGSGKSSFIGAGLVPARPEGWAIVRCTPGNAAVDSLRRAVIPEIEDDAEAVRSIAAGGDAAIAEAFSAWRRRHDQALLIVDQLEELFTQNSGEEQRRCAEILGRIALNADVHVVLSMRDDFLMRCHEHEELLPMFSELTGLRPPVGGALRRAVVQPALRCGYRFEDEELADEILAEVEGERGALPLLAFALARLWEQRDKESGLITRQAYRDIGGVGGALAQHAEATLKRIGIERVPIVRELFRNLVTAQGTRVARDTDELLSVFRDDRDDAEEVLRALVDARLLTSYELPSDDDAGRQRIEVIHESLVSGWPRLVGWRTQDADAARLRDELRQAARTWEEHGRADDRLWTGAAFKEYEVWHERYPGGLTELEEEFAQAMTSLAARRRRRRRLAVAAVIVILLAVLGVVFVSRQQAVAEANRAEASKLLALAQLQLETDPTEALAYATASLELADTEEARVFAMLSLWAGPPLRALEFEETAGRFFAVPTFSPNGRWLAVAGLANENVLVYGEDGREPVVLGGHAAVADEAAQCIWSAHGLLVTGHWTEGRAREWAMPEGRVVREIDLGGGGYFQVGETHLFAEVFDYDPDTWVFPPEVVRLRSWRLAGGEPEELGTVEGPLLWYSAFDPVGGAWVFQRGGSIFSRPLPVRADVPDRVVARHSSDTARVGHWRRGQGLYSSDDSGELVLWTTAEGTSVEGQRLGRPETAATRLRPDPSGRWAVDADETIREGQASLWDLRGLAGARPIELRRSGSWYYSFSDFHPGGRWVVATTNDLTEVSFWPLQSRPPHVVDGYETKFRRSVRFTHDGRYLVTHWGRDPVRVRLWPLPGAGDRDVVDLMLSRDGPTQALAVDPTGRNVLSTGYGSEIFLVSLTGAAPRQLDGLGSDLVNNGTFSPSGRLAAAASTYSERQPTLWVWDLASGESRVFDQPQDSEAERFTSSIAFVDETTLYTGGTYGLLRWDLEAGTYDKILEVPPGNTLEFSMASDRRRSLVYELGPSDDRLRAALHDLETGDVRSLDIPGQGFVIALSPDGTTWATGEGDGSVWIGRIDGGEAHLLAGHEGPVDSVAISPDNRWIASSGYDKTLRLWQMPDFDEPPLHTLPRDELIAKLKTLTNLRAVRDGGSSTGWTIEVGPFPGWETVPTW